MNWPQLTWVLLLAVIMAAFGVLGYRRGTKSSLATAAVIWLSMLLVDRAGGPVATALNGLNYGIRFILAGGLEALGGGGDRATAIAEVTARLGDVKPLMTADGSGPGLLLVGLLVLVCGILIGLIPWFKGKPSLPGFLVGLVNGYLVAALAINGLWPGMIAPLPLPFGIGAGLSIGAQPAASASPPGANQSLWSSVVSLIDSLQPGQLAIVVAVVIWLFLLLAARAANRTTKKE